MKDTIRRILREELNKNMVRDLLNSIFEGFDDIYYDWAEFNCGMGVCCDPYSIGFILPKSDYNDYIFKLVDGKDWEPNGYYPPEITNELPEVCHEYPDVKNPNFDTLVFYEIFAEEIENFLGSKKNWDFNLLEMINEMFGCQAKRIIFI